jgi:uncharacterized protein (TIGR03435 family)
MTRTRSILLFAATVLFAIAPQFAQTQAKPSFDVISIKPTAPGQRGGGGGVRGDKYTMSSIPLRALLQTAYQRPSSGGPVAQLQIIGAPGWIDADRYDIQATADCSGGPVSREQLQLMVRSLVEERFQLKAHLETRELPIYNLVVAKDGPKIKRSEDQTPVAQTQVQPPQLCAPLPPPPTNPPIPFVPPGQRGSPFDPASPAPRGFMGGLFSSSLIMFRGSAVPLTNMIGMMQQQVGRPVIDKTELKGLFDFTLRFSPEGVTSTTPFGALPPPPPLVPGGAPPAAGTAPASEPLPSIFTALQEIGLRLEPTKGPVEVLVIESVQKPTEN